MATTIKEMTVRKRTPRFDVIWFNGENALDVAHFVQAHGRGNVEVKFDSSGATRLYFFGNGVQLRPSQKGVWIAADGQTLTQAEIDNEHEVLESR